MNERSKTGIVLIFTVLTFFSCSADDELEFRDQREKDTEQRMLFKDHECHILIIGNSLARDAFCYVPPILEELCPTLSVFMDIMYVSGKPLSTHWNYINKKKYSFTWDTYSTLVGRWETESYQFADDIFNSKKWDVIIFQEGSVNARTYESTQPFVVKITNYIRQYLPDVTFAYTLIPSLPDGAVSINGTTSDDIWKKNAITAELLYKEGLVSYIIPCGTAIQNARKTTLDRFGDFGHLSYDGRHLQEGIPCLIDAYAATESILKILGYHSTIENSQILVTQKWVYAINVLGRHGAVVEGDASDYLLAKRCAILSIENPFLITTP